MQRHVVSIDSRDRDFTLYPKPNDYVVALPYAFHDIASVELVGVELPMSFYVFSAAAGNTSFALNVFAGQSVASGLLARLVVTLPDGNYTSDTFGPVLQTAIKAAAAASSVQSLAATTYTVAVDVGTLRLSIACDQGLGLQVDTTGFDRTDAVLPTEWGLAYHAGFPRGLSAVASKLVAPSIVSLSPYTYVVMSLGNIHGLSTCGIGGSGSSTRAFAKLPLVGNSGDVLHLGRSDLVPSDNAGSKTLAKIGTLASLAIHFRFHDGRAVDFNGVEHSFTLELVWRPNFLDAASWR